MINIAMWSGPRNISTAMMRAWENRSDSMVMDEPFYAAYLYETGLQHPMRDEIIGQGETDWRKVSLHCSQSAPSSPTICYQKQMTHHMLAHYDWQWLASVKHAFLLRHPHDVLLSYQQKHRATTLDDIGLPQQLAIFKRVSELTVEVPMVIDSVVFLQNPEQYLRAMCDYFDIEFESTMLSWQAGARDSDGVWASHWYDKVCRSTGFVNSISQREARDSKPLNGSLSRLLEQALPLYDELMQYHY